MKQVLEELEWRGLLHNHTFDLDNNNPITFYTGFDPTSDSLHVGNLIPLITALRLKKLGHIPIFLIGGATGLIGDPSGKSEERNFNSENTVDDYVFKLTKQLSKLTNNCLIVNNYEWVKNIDIISFLRDYGKYFNVSWMLSKDSVRNRLDNGISFTEFSYMIIQALDFLYLHGNYNCNLQIGGSDQFGNMTAGMELIRKKLSKEVFSLTTPLLLTHDSKKFGKSETGTIWLDKDKTSILDFYNFWINVSDNDVIKLLKQFTFLSKHEISELELSLANEPHLRIPHKKLANEMTTFVHGELELSNVLNLIDILFNDNIIFTLSKEELKTLFNTKGFIEYNDNTSLIDILVKSNICNSKNRARELILSNSISINGVKIVDTNFKIDKNDCLFNQFLVLKKGKKQLEFIKIVF